VAPPNFYRASVLASADGAALVSAGVDDASPMAAPSSQLLASLSSPA
jgi:hypothetical protein